jgi:DNA-binding SARP family transcriptional activator
MAIGGRHNAPAGADRLTLTDEFDLVLGGQRVGVPHSIERVVAYLALASQPVHRAKLAGVLWPDAPDALAAKSLRTALWRVHRSRIAVLDVLDDRVALAAPIRVDVKDLLDVCRRVLERFGDGVEGLEVLVDHGDLLPDWDDEWVVADRERFRLLRLQALELGAERLLERGEFGRAMEAAVSAIAGDPFRESARRLAMRVHLAQGNVASALAVYGEYQVLLDVEIGIEPSRTMRALVESGIDGAGVRPWVPAASGALERGTRASQ